MRTRDNFPVLQGQLRASADSMTEGVGHASLHPPESIQWSAVTQRAARWSESDQVVLEQHRPGTSLVDDALMQIFYDTSDTGGSIATVLEMNGLTDNFDRQLQLRGILSKIILNSGGELQTVATHARDDLHAVITQNESRLQHEDDYIYSFRKSQLRKGEDIPADPATRDEVAQNLESLFPNGIMVCFSIPDAFLSKADAKKKIKNKEQATSFAQKQGTTLEEMQEISYTNEAEFLNSAFPYAKAHNAVGLYGNQLKIGIPTLYTSPEEIGIKARSIQQQLAAILGHDHPAARIKFLAIFTHGSVTNVSGRKAQPGWGYTLPTDNTKIKKHHLPDLVGSLPLTDDASVRLFACNTGRTEGVAKDEDDAGTGEGGFSDAFRDEMLKQGYDQASVIGHIVAGHAIRNMQQRLFIGDSETSFNIQVGKNILRENLPDNYQDRINSELEPSTEEQDGILNSMIWLYQNESWLINFPDIPEQQEEESREEYQSKFRKAMFAQFFAYWLARVKENRLILSKKYT